MATVPAGFPRLGFSPFRSGLNTQYVLNRGNGLIEPTGSAAAVNAITDAARAEQVANDTGELERRQAVFNNAAEQATSPDAYQTYMAAQACCLKGRMGAVQAYGLPYDSMYRLASAV